MAIGYVLITTEPGKDHDAYSQLLRVPEIKELVPLFGEFDLIAKVEAESFDEVGRVVVEAIRSVPCITTTRTLAGAKF
jgi:DNA-binding Lrp family transcriptional regulator